MQSSNMSSNNDNRVINLKDPKSLVKIVKDETTGVFKLIDTTTGAVTELADNNGVIQVGPLLELL